MAHPCEQALVIDDDAAIREVIADALRLEGIDVVLVRGAHEAIQALDTGCRPCVILLDLLMPGTSGIDLMDALRRHPAGSGVPIIAMSASPILLNKVEEKQPDARLPKPFDLDSLYDLVARLCTSAGP